MADHDVEKRETQKASLTAHHRTLRAIDRAWDAIDYMPYQHLETVTAEGDPTVLNDLYERMRSGYGSETINSFGRWLAANDIQEIGRAIRSSERATSTS